MFNHEIPEDISVSRYNIKKTLFGSFVSFSSYNKFELRAILINNL